MNEWLLVTTSWLYNEQKQVVVVVLVAGSIALFLRMTAHLQLDALNVHTDFTSHITSHISRQCEHPYPTHKHKIMNTMYGVACIFLQGNAYTHCSAPVASENTPITPAPMPMNKYSVPISLNDGVMA